MLKSIADLKRQQTDLEEVAKKHCTELYELISKSKEISYNLECLKFKTSTLASDLRKDFQKELEDINDEIRKKEEEYERLEEELKSVEKELDARLNNTALYIEKETDLMVSEFFEYLKQNIKYIVLHSLEFALKPCESVDVDENDREYITYTNQIKLTTNRCLEQPIYVSTEFYFTNPKYVLYNEKVPLKGTPHTEWFLLFFKRFMDVFFEKLKIKFHSTEFYGSLKINICKYDVNYDLTEYSNYPSFTIKLL